MILLFGFVDLELKLDMKTCEQIFFMNLQNQLIDYFASIFYTVKNDGNITPGNVDRFRLKKGNFTSVNFTF